ncbi:MAG: XTP/dITP diphosphohydrolase [Verrucomicrobiota bacterium]|jgi:XTP/dITP diphosphohydrolase
MIPLLIATHNPHKTLEFQQIFGSDFRVCDLSDFPEFPAIVESGKTFAENARVKALEVSQRMPGLVLADDSGLEVDGLSGAPGIFSARYAGEKATDEENIVKLLKELRQKDPTKEKRGARFRCQVALAHRGKLLQTFSGVVEGIIVDPPRGEKGFGYDPIFMPNGFERTFAELLDTEKNRISHRANAIKAVKEFFTTAPRSW